MSDSNSNAERRSQRGTQADENARPDSLDAPEAHGADSPETDSDQSDSRISTTGERFAAQSKVFVKRLQGLGRRLQQPWRSGDSLLEIAQSIRYDLEQALQPMGGGRRVFPCSRVEVELLPRDDEQSSLFLAAIAEGWSDELQTSSLEQLQRAGAAIEQLDLAVTVGVAAEARDVLSDEKPGHRDLRSPGEERYRLLGVPFEDSDVSSRRAAAEESEDSMGQPVQQEPATVLRLLVEEGTAKADSFEFRGEVVAIGRMEQVFDQHGRIRRRNDVAFEDEGEINSTVSREHARIRYDDSSRDYWIIDDRSSYGTRIFRDGKAIDVSSRDRRGIRLRNGDRVYLGRAVLACELE